MKQRKQPPTNAKGGSRRATPNREFIIIDDPLGDSDRQHVPAGAHVVGLGGTGAHMVRALMTLGPRKVSDRRPRGSAKSARVAVKASGKSSAQQPPRSKET
jgi:hypothetical protein